MFDFLFLVFQKVFRVNGLAPLFEALFPLVFLPHIRKLSLCCFSNMNLKDLAMKLLIQDLQMAGTKKRVLLKDALNRFRYVFWVLTEKIHKQCV